MVYKADTEGGISGHRRMIEAVRDRLNGRQHGDKVSPIVRLEKDSYHAPAVRRGPGRRCSTVVGLDVARAVRQPAPASPPPPSNRAGGGRLTPMCT